MGSASGFAPVESMPDHVILTKYNALVYRAQQQRQAKVQAMGYIHVHPFMVSSIDFVSFMKFHQDILLILLLVD